MKKFFIPLATLLLTAVAAMALEWPAGVNIAGNEGVTVTPSSQREGNAPTIVYDNQSGDWSSLKPSLTDSESFFILDLGENPQNYNTVEIRWRDNHPSKFSIYTSATAFNTTEKTGTDGEGENAKEYSYLLLDADQLGGMTPVYTGEAADGWFVSEITLEETQTDKRYLLVYADECNGVAKDWGIGLNYIKVGNFENRDQLDHIAISSVDAEENVAAKVEVNAYNKYGEVLEAGKMVNLQLTTSAPELTIGEDTDSDNGFYVTGSKSGVYTLKAVCSNNDVEYTAEQNFIVNFPWGNVENIATGKEVVASRNVDASTNPNPAKNAIDGNVETYYEFDGDWGGGDAYIVIDLGATYVVDAVGVLWNYAAGQFFVAYGAEGATIPENNEVYNRDRMTGMGWTVTSQQPRNKIRTTVEELHTARYIMVGDADNPSGKPHVCEIYVNGKIREEDVWTLGIAPVSRFLSTDQIVEYNAKLTNQYGEEKELPGDVYYTMYGPDSDFTKGFAFPTVDGTEDGKPGNKCGFTYVEGGKLNNKLGKYTVKAVCGDYEASDNFYLVTNIGSLDEENVGELTLGDVTLESSKVKTGGISWGENDPTDLRTLKLTFGYPVPAVGDGEPEAQADEEPRTFNLDLITLDWEASAPEEYEVYVTNKDNACLKVLSVEGRTFTNGANYIDNIYNENILATAPSGNGISFRNVESGTSYLDYVKSIEVVPVKGNGNYRLLLNHLYVRGVDSKTGTPTEVKLVPAAAADAPVDVYSISGVCVARGVRMADIADLLPAGLYIAGGRKICIKK